MEKITEFLTQVVIEASKLITNDFWVKAKDDKGDLVTNFDLEVEKFIISRLIANYPEYKIVSEEFNSNECYCDNFFTIDPIDGTINFANGLPFWGIQVACVKEGKPCSSVIFLPKLNELFVADSSGAYLNGEQISVSKLEAKSCLYSIESKGKLATECILNMIDCYPHQRKFYCAALEFAYVACGRLGGIGFLSDNLWDYLPGCYLVERAGGVVSHKVANHIAANSEQMLEVLTKYCK